MQNISSRLLFLLFFFDCASNLSQLTFFLRKRNLALLFSLLYSVLYFFSIEMIFSHRTVKSFRLSVSPGGTERLVAFGPGAVVSGEKKNRSPFRNKI